MHSAKKKLEQGFKGIEKDIIISSTFGVIIATVLTLLFYGISFVAVNVALAKRKIDPIPWDEFTPFFVIGFIALMIMCKHYQPKEHEKTNLSKYHMILNASMIVPNFVNQNAQDIFDLFQLKSSSYSLDLAIEILKMSKKGTAVKEIYSKHEFRYKGGQVRLTISLLEKAEFIFINKTKWECFTTEGGDRVLLEWRQQNDN
ncbi:hypothetical protein [Candidatus Uabimicrobium sp. HlEnr_7]|uniref:hypothetical protein n=1 Tax=Candidatus Uabimicrobium helgolandensis TaxID=3095367 RepID=UPI003558BAF3